MVCCDVNDTKKETTASQTNYFCRQIKKQQTTTTKNGALRQKATTTTTIKTIKGSKEINATAEQMCVHKSNSGIFSENQISQK